MFSKIVVALNDLPESQRALRTAIDLARSCNAELATVSILGDPPAYTSFSAVVDPGSPAALMEERRHRHNEMHEEAANLARELGVHSTYLVGGTPSMTSLRTLPAAYRCSLSSGLE